MDKDMQIDNDPEMDATTSNFIFSTPNIIPSPQKSVNFGVYSDNIFGNRSTQLYEGSSFFTFAKPAIIERQDGANAVGMPVESTEDMKSPVSAHDIKKTLSFGQLEKNSKKKQDVRLEFSKSITCTDVPDALLVKSVAKEYFEQFGETLKVTVRPKRKMITVYFATKDAANTAFYKSGFFGEHKFKIERTTSDMLLKQKPKESIKGKIASILNIDEDVKEELEALRGLEYNLPDPQHLRALTVAAKAKVKKAKVVANKEIPKHCSPLTAKPLIKSAKSTASVEKLQPITEVPIGNKNIKKISSATIEELQSQVRQVGITSEEKYKILDARDRLMRLKHAKQKNLATAKLTKGTCPDMCPEKERYMREFQRQISSFELLEDIDYKINDSTAVKQYSRSSADQEEPMSHDLRPVKSLKMTMSYLLHKIADLSEDEDTNLGEWYHFLWDRMRSIRKDITQQELCCTETVELVEQCARFHILSSERLCAEETSVFDPKINSENLTKCLQTLKYMYYDLRENGISCKNEPEFRAYVILLNLNNGTFISELSTLSHNVQHSHQVKFALDIYSAIAMNNYSRFFKLVRKTTYLNACILLRYFNQVRMKALTVMVKAYCRTSGTAEYPLYELIDILGFEDEDEVFDFCSRIGLKCDKESLYIKLNKENFHIPDCNMEQGRAFNLVLSKRLLSNQSIGQCIAGGTWPDKTYENHKPHSSFDSQGYLLPSSINAQDQNLVDPYEFMDDDVELISEQKESKFSTKISNDIGDRKQMNAAIRISDTDLPEPKKEPILSQPSSSKSQSSGDKDTTQINTEKTFFAPTSTSSIFSKTLPTIFSVVPTKTSTLTTSSPFNKPANKSIFAGCSHANLFQQPSIPSTSLKDNSGSGHVHSNASNSSSSSSSSNNNNNNNNNNERVTAKRRLEDSESSIEKKSLLNKEELRKRQLEMEERMRLERDKLHRLERINKRSVEHYEHLQREVVGEMCSELVHAELERARLFEALAERICEGLVKELCEGILDEQLFVQDMLIEVRRRLRDRLLLKYSRAWKEWAAKRRTQRREALDNTPVWLQPESLEERARKLYQPQQKTAIKYARDCRRHRAEPQLVTKTPRCTPIEYVVSVGLKENSKLLEVEPSQHIFWKMVISWPLLENRLTLWRHKKVVNRYLSPSDSSLEPIFIRHKAGEQERLDICIRYFEGLVCENCLTGMDGLLLVVSTDEDLYGIERRLTKAVLSREKLMPIPLVILVFGDVDHDPDTLKLAPVAEGLLESGHLSEYTVLRERNVNEDVVLRIMQSAILWLAINRSPAVPLEMDYIKRIFDDCLTEDLWMRIHGHLSRDPQFAKPLNDPNFIISLHNEAVNHIMDIVMDPESMTYTDFAPELKIYLKNKKSYPCSYEYFDPVWKHLEYRAELERIISSFIFPPWRDAWPIRDMMKLHDSIVTYCRQIISYESSLAIAKNIMSDLFLITGYSEDSYPSISDIVIHLVAKKISDIGGNARVVYNKNHIKHFQTLPWWFKSSVLMDYVVRQEHEDEEDVNDNVTSDFECLTEMEKGRIAVMPMDLELECEIDELSETCKHQDDDMLLSDYCQETRKQITDMQGRAERLEKQLEEQRFRSQILETRLREALGDEALEYAS